MPFSPEIKKALSTYNSQEIFGRFFLSTDPAVIALYELLNEEQNNSFKICSCFLEKRFQKLDGIVGLQQDIYNLYLEILNSIFPGDGRDRQDIHILLKQYNLWTPDNFKKLDEYQNNLEFLTDKRLYPIMALSGILSFVAELPTSLLNQNNFDLILQCQEPAALYSVFTRLNKISDLRILTQERLEFILKLNSISYLDEYLEYHNARYKPSKNFTAEIFDNAIQEIKTESEKRPLKELGYKARLWQANDQQCKIALQSLTQFCAKLHSQPPTSNETGKSDEGHETLKI